jgi:LPS export ABC transporter protein LptC/lipopolysaccharide transport protein LptA
MPLKKELTHRLIKIFQVVLPVLIVALIAVPAWNYWAKMRLKQRLPDHSKLPKELSIRTDNFNFSKTQGKRTVFTIHADTNLGFSDDQNRLQGVNAIIYGDNPSDPPRKLKAANCTYNQKSDDMECSGNVELQLDDATTVHTETAVYNHANQTITSNTQSHIVRGNQMTGQADHLEYSMSSGLLKLAGAVNILGSQGVELQSQAAVFQQKENWASASDGVFMKSQNGWMRGQHARAELIPVTYQPRAVVMEGDVTSEATSRDRSAVWNMRSSWAQATFTPKGVVDHVLARTNVELIKKATDNTVVLTGNEVETQMNDAGRMDFVEARQNARMKFGDDRLLTAETIWANADEAVTTNGASLLNIGESHINGSVFQIQNGDVVTFHTDKRAILTQQDRVTSADVTDARFDNRTNQLVSLVQTGRFTVKQGDQNGKANKATIESGGDLMTLEGAAKVTDPKLQVEANTIQINYQTKTKTASKNVKTVSLDSGERVLVTADHVVETEENATYSGTAREKVHLYRGPGSIEADKVEGPVGSKVFKATATGRVFSTMNNIRVWADRLDYDDGIHIAHYIGSVTAFKQDMKITSADMVVKLNDDTSHGAAPFTESSVQEITAKDKVVVTRNDNRGTGDQAVYDADTQQIVLSGGSPQVTYGQGNTTTGPRITLNVSGDKMTVVEGNSNQRGVTTHRVKPH